MLVYNGGQEAPMNKNLVNISRAAVLMALSLAAAPAGAVAKKAAAGDGAGTVQSAADLRSGMRKLWEDHIAYTRNFIISALAGLDDTSKVAERLLKNQDDIGDAIKPIYGEEAGKKLTALLRDHILIAADIVKAAKANDGKGVDAGEKKWHANAGDIATFLSGANPSWKKPMLADMLDKHLEYTTTEVTSRLKKDWPADIKAYDQGHEHMLMFADMLTDGIVKQFPKKFSK
jgi:hypothetical protein